MSTAEEKAAAQVRDLTDEVEAGKERKKEDREEKKRLKDRQQRRENREKWVAPILLLTTALISFLIIFLN